jgi:peptidoglycan/LPS O-acetylase OafA/YrhL
MPTSASPGRLYGLDALRGLAATAVMLFHYNLWYREVGGGRETPFLTTVFLHGQFGVELFFIVSGFVIFMTLERTGTLSAFASVRFARLYPAFATCLLVTLAVFALLGQPPSLPNYRQILANASMMPELFGYGGLDGSYWTLLYEIVFYALAATVCIGLGWREPELPCAGWLAVALVVRLTGQHGIIEQLTAARFAHLFVIGVLLYRIRVGRGTPLTGFLLVTAPLFAMFGPTWFFRPLSIPFYISIVGGLALLVWLASDPNARILRNGTLQFLGRISYPLYLVHQSAGYVVISRLHAAGFAPDAAITATAGLAILTAWAISWGVEYPAQRWLRGWFAVRRSRTPVSAAV